MPRAALIAWGVNACLAAGALFAWWALAQAQSRPLTVSFLDVGQGDAIFIQAPSGRQMLVDGGAGRAVLRELGALLPWYDRSIDVIIATHPDQDHIGGLSDVLARFSVSYVFRSSVADDGGDARAFERAVAAEVGDGAQEFIALRGDVVDLGGGVRATVLFPDRAVEGVETNTGSIVLLVSYGDTAFLLTGDSPAGVETYLASLDGQGLRADVLKAGHHGSDTSSSEAFVGRVSPRFVVFSRGCDNRYGHPHQDVVARFADFGVETFDTCDEGTVSFSSDGSGVRKTE